MFDHLLTGLRCTRGQGCGYNAALSSSSLCLRQLCSLEVGVFKLPVPHELVPVSWVPAMVTWKVLTAIFQDSHVVMDLRLVTWLLGAPLMTLIPKTASRCHQTSKWP